MFLVPGIETRTVLWRQISQTMEPVLLQELVVCHMLVRYAINALKKTSILFSIMFENTKMNLITCYPFKYLIQKRLCEKIWNTRLQTKCNFKIVDKFALCTISINIEAYVNGSHPLTTTTYILTTKSYTEAMLL